MELNKIDEAYENKMVAFEIGQLLVLFVLFQDVLSLCAVFGKRL